MRLTSKVKSMGKADRRGGRGENRLKMNDRKKVEKTRIDRGYW